MTIHWNGGRHTELRVSRVRCGRYPEDRRPSPVEVVRNGKAWTTVRVRELRERLGITPFDPQVARVETISADETATRLGIRVGSVQKLIREGVLPATQLLPSAPWQIPVAALESKAIKTGVREIIGRRPRNYRVLQDDRTLKLPGL